MNIIACILIILILSAVTFLQSYKERRSIKKRIMGTELDYLYAYHDILLKVMQVEAELSKADELIKQHPSQATSYFSSIEMVQLKQNAKQKIEILLDNFRNGYISPSATKSQLNDLSKKLHILFSEKAA